MSGICRMIGGAFVLLALASTSWAVMVVDYNPAIRDGGFETYDPNATGPQEFWFLNGNANLVQHISDLNGQASGGLNFTGPANASQGSNFAALYSRNDDSHPLGQADGQFRSTAGPTPPFIGVHSVTLSFDYSLSGTVSGNTQSDLVLFSPDHTDHAEFKTPILVSADPTQWTHVDITFTGPFPSADNNPDPFQPPQVFFSDIGQIRLDFNVRGTGADDAVLSVDAVRLTFTLESELPEPASLGILGFSSLGLLMRRRGC